MASQLVQPSCYSLPAQLRTCFLFYLKGQTPNWFKHVSCWLAQLPSESKVLLKLLSSEVITKDFTTKYTFDHLSIPYPSIFHILGKKHPKIPWDELESCLNWIILMNMFANKLLNKNIKN